MFVSHVSRYLLTFYFLPIPLRSKERKKMTKKELKLWKYFCWRKNAIYKYQDIFSSDSMFLTAPLFPSSWKQQNFLFSTQNLVLILQYSRMICVKPCRRAKNGISRFHSLSVSPTLSSSCSLSSSSSSLVVQIHRFKFLLSHCYWSMHTAQLGNACVFLNPFIVHAAHIIHIHSLSRYVVMTERTHPHLPLITFDRCVSSFTSSCVLFHLLHITYHIHQAWNYTLHEHHRRFCSKTHQASNNQHIPDTASKYVSSHLLVQA